MTEENKIFDPREMPPFTDRLLARINIAAASGKKPTDHIKVQLSDLFGITMEVSNAHQRLAGLLGLDIQEEENE